MSSQSSANRAIALTAVVLVVIVGAIWMFAALIGSMLPPAGQTATPAGVQTSSSEMAQQRASSQAAQERAQTGSSEMAKQAAQSPPAETAQEPEAQPAQVEARQARQPAQSPAPSEKKPAQQQLEEAGAQSLEAISSVLGAVRDVFVGLGNLAVQAGKSIWSAVSAVPNLEVPQLATLAGAQASSASPEEVENLETELALAKLSTRLVELRYELEEGTDAGQIAKEVEKLKSQIEALALEASPEQQRFLEELAQELAALAKGLAAGDERAQDQLDALSEKLKNRLK